MADLQNPDAPVQVRGTLRFDVGTAPVLLRGVLHVLLLLLGVLLLWAAVFRWDRATALHDPRLQALLTVLGLVVGAWFAGILSRGRKRYPRLVIAGLLFLIASQVCFLLLVWTRLKTGQVPWSCWWLTMIPAATITHTVWLRMTAAPDRRGMLRVAIGCAIFVGAMLASLALRAHILANPFTGFVWVVGIPAAFSTVFTLILWFRGVRLFRGGIPRPVRIGWRIVGYVILAAIAFYLGRATAPAPSMFDASASPLVQMSAEELSRQTMADLQRLKAIAGQLEQLESRVQAGAGEMAKRRQAEGRSRLTPEEDDSVRAQFMTYLACRDGLLRMVAVYSGYEAVRDPDLRARCVLLGHASGSLVFQYSLKLVNWYSHDDAVRQKLNEANPRWGISAGMFDRIFANVASSYNAEALAEISAYVDANRTAWRDAQVFPADEMDSLTSCIARSAEDIRAHQLNPIGARWDRAVARVKQDAYSPIYTTQSVVSTWIGDTRLVQWEPLITLDQIHAMQSKLEPGDILLERRSWFLSNAFLPGFWPHTAMYIGTRDDLLKLGLLKQEAGASGAIIATEANVKRHLQMLLQPAADGQPHTVIEAVSEGVILNSLTESMHADFVAVLRPRLTAQQKAQAIANAFEHIGKPYDFEFDFSTADKLVCSEVVYRAYGGMIGFDPYVQKIMGREALPPLEIARKFANERGRDNRELDFVLFLDGVPSRREARLADETVFCSSIDRPRGFSE